MGPLKKYHNFCPWYHDRRFYEEINIFYCTDFPRPTWVNPLSLSLFPLYFPFLSLFPTEAAVLQSALFHALLCSSAVNEALSHSPSVHFVSLSFCQVFASWIVYGYRYRPQSFCHEQDYKSYWKWWSKTNPCLVPAQIHPTVPTLEKQHPSGEAKYLVSLFTNMHSPFHLPCPVHLRQCLVPQWQCCMFLRLRQLKANLKHMLFYEEKLGIHYTNSIFFPSCPTSFFSRTQKVHRLHFFLFLGAFMDQKW